jgi:hypothetical protein
MGLESASYGTLEYLARFYAIRLIGSEESPFYPSAPTSLGDASGFHTLFKSGWLYPNNMPSPTDSF